MHYEEVGKANEYTIHMLVFGVSYMLGYLVTVENVTVILCTMFLSVVMCLWECFIIYLARFYF